ncbi:hypothetical protein HG530_007669 [Fusarium avenaceum]|nr:hypothetical protein HG530_007669 [Fusarium avenaceum]
MDKGLTSSRALELFPTPKTCALLAVERRRGAVRNTEDVRIIGRTIGHLREIWHTIETREFEDVLVGAVEFLFLKGHEEIYNGESSVVVDGHVDGCLLHRSWRREAVDRNGGELRGISVSSSEEHRSRIVGRKATSRLPDSRTGDIAAYTKSLGGPVLNDVARGFVPAHDPAGEVILHAMRRKASVDILSRVKQSRALMMNTAGEHTLGIVSRDDSLQINREVGLLGEVVDVDSVNLIPSCRASLGNLASLLVDVCFGGEIPSPSVWIYDSCCCNPNCWINIDTAIEISREKGDADVA